VVGKLVLDALWRGRSAYAMVLFIVPLGWLGIAKGGLPVSWGLMLSATLAYAFGSIGTIPAFGLRELKTLPVTNRDLWVASWVQSVVAIPLALALARNITLIAVWLIDGTVAVTVQTLLLLTLYDAAYAGALLPAGPAMGYALNHATNSASGWRSRWPWAVASIAGVAVFMGGLAIPYLIAGSVPLTLDKFTPGTTFALGVLVACATGGLLWTPHRVGGAGMRVAGTANPSASRQEHRPRFTDQLTGIPRIAWPLITMLLLASMTTVAGFIGYWTLFEQGSSLRSFLQNNAVLLFETGFLPTPDMGRLWILLAVVFITTSNPWQSFTKQFRILPLTPGRINALLIATPFVQWAVVWMVLILTHLAVIGSLPKQLRPDVFLLVGGGASFGQAMTIRYGHKGHWWFIFLLGGLMPMAERLSRSGLSAPAEVIMVGIGLAALSAAAWTNHRTLTRSTSSAKVYGPEQLPFGITAPGVRP
jgi:hypothetical protein